MPLSDEEFGRLTRETAALKVEIDKIEAEIKSIGSVLRDVGLGLSKPDGFSYWNSPYDGNSSRPQMAVMYDFNACKEGVDKSAKGLADYRRKKEELSQLEFRLQHS